MCTASFFPQLPLFHTFFLHLAEASLAQLRRRTLGCMQRVRPCSPKHIQLVQEQSVGVKCFALLAQHTKNQQVHGLGPVSGEGLKGPATSSAGAFRGENLFSANNLEYGWRTKPRSSLGCSGLLLLIFQRKVSPLWLQGNTHGLQNITPRLDKELITPCAAITSRAGRSHKEMMYLPRFLRNLFKAKLL